MIIRYTIYAGHRDVDVDVRFNRDVSTLDFSTGIINVKNSEEFSDHKGLRACWGTAYPSSEKDSVMHPIETIGLAVFVPDTYCKQEMPANKDNYGFVLHTNSRELHYRFLFASNNESFGFHSANAWFNFLKQWRKEVEKPIEINTNKL